MESPWNPGRFTKTEAPYQLLPALRAEEFRALKADIAQRGVLVPIERDDRGVLLDGHHRLRAIEELRAKGMQVADPPVIVRVGLSEAEKRSHVRSLNLHRRHLTAAERRAVIAAQLEEAPEVSDRSVAHALSVSPSTVAAVRRRLGDVPSERFGQLERRVGRDGRRRRLPQRRAILAPSESHAKRAIAALEIIPDEALPERVLTASDTAVAAQMISRDANREKRLERLRDPGSLRNTGIGKYAVLLVDPPWRYSGASDPTRTAENHYPTMPHEELLELPVGEIAAPSSVLFLWATPPKVAEAVELIAKWGFRFKTCAVWDKERLGLGSWYRLQHELVLVATRGKLPPPAPVNRPLSVIRSPRLAHSAKPAAVRQQIERMYPDVPRIELFARGRIDGWDVWGLEAESVAI